MARRETPGDQADVQPDPPPIAPLDLAQQRPQAGLAAHLQLEGRELRARGLAEAFAPAATHRVAGRFVQFDARQSFRLEPGDCRIGRVGLDEAGDFGALAVRRFVEDVGHRVSAVGSRVRIGIGIRFGPSLFDRPRDVPSAGEPASLA